MKITKVLLLLVMAACASDAANILALLLIPSPSHHTWNRSLMLALAARGHKVSVLTTDKEKNPVPNYTETLIDSTTSIVVSTAMKITKVLLLLVMATCASDAANILALLLIPSPSHHIWNRSLMLALAARGHKVTVLTTDKEKNPVPNYTEYVIKETYDYGMEVTEMYDLSPFEFVDLFFEWQQVVCDRVVSSEGAKEVLRLANSTSFDAIIADVTSVCCQLGFVHAFRNPPLIGMTAYSHPIWISHMTGNPHNPAYIPDLASSFSDHMTFWQRLSNTMYLVYFMYQESWFYLPKVDAMVQEYFGKSTPPVSDIRNNVSLVLVNTHVSFDPPRPLVPAVVEVAGMHIGPPEPLPQHLKKEMDKAKDGFIYFSLGSNLRSDKMPVERRQVFLDTFSKLPYKVFWKWESDSLPGQPSNVIVGKWMPQRDILAHPNILLFITHNGLLSTQEAIYNGVPMVGVPFVADQKINGLKAKAQGFAETVDYRTVTADQLLATIRRVVTDKRYKENVERLSKMIRDQPQTPLERAVFWTEYVIRHKGAPHLRSAAADMPWYQYLLLDVLCVLAAGALLVLLLLYKTCYVVLRLLTQPRKPTKQKKH